MNARISQFLDSAPVLNDLEALRTYLDPADQHIFEEMRDQGRQRRDGDLQLPSRTAPTRHAATCRSSPLPRSTTTVNTPAPS